jgi:hypothetical protein
MNNFSAIAKVYFKQQGVEVLGWEENPDPNLNQNHARSHAIHDSLSNGGMKTSKQLYIKEKAQISIGQFLFWR